MLLSRTNTCKKYSLHASVERASLESCVVRACVGAGAPAERIAQIRSARNRFVGARHDVADDIVGNDRLSFRAAIAGVHSWACIARLGHKPRAPGRGEVVSSCAHPARIATCLFEGPASPRQYRNGERFSAMPRSWRGVVCRGGACSASGCYIDTLRGCAIRSAGIVRQSTALAMSLIPAPCIAADLEFDLAL